MRYTFFPLLLPQGELSTYGNSIVYSMESTTQTLSTTESKVTLDTESQIDTDTYSTSSGVITIKEDGTYLIINHAAVDDGGGIGSNRTSGETFLHINSTLVAGCYTDGFLRRTSSFEWSDCGYGIYDLSANDTVEMRQLRINAAGSDGRLVGSAETNIDAKTSLSIIKLNSDNAKIILEATTAQNQQLTTQDTYVDMNWDSSISKDTGFTHSTTTNSDEITLDAIGKYLVVYSNSWERDTDDANREGVYEVLRLDGSVIPGSFHNNYIRGSQSAESITRGNNSAATIIETTAVNQVITLSSSLEAGAINCTRLPLKSRITIYKLDGTEQIFRAESTSTQNLGSTTETTLVYDSTDFISSGLSLSSNQITSTDGGKYLIFEGVQGNGNTTARTGCFQYGNYDGNNNKYGSCTKYSRDSGSMEMVCPHFGSIESIDPNKTIKTMNTNLFVDSTALPRITNTGAFVGIKLKDYIAPNTPQIQNYVYSSASSTTSITMTKPTGVVSGDLLIMMVANSNVASLTDFGTVTGWTRFININAGLGPAQACYWRISDGTEGTSESVASTTSSDIHGLYLRITGANTTTPIDVQGSGDYPGFVDSVTISSLTSTVDDCLGIYFSTLINASGTPSSISGTGWIEEADTSSNTLAGNFGYKELETAGGTGTVTVTFSTSAGIGGLMFVIKPD